MIKEFKIFEGKNIGNLYHFTGFLNIIRILHDNELTTTTSSYISVSRNKLLYLIRPEGVKTEVRITLDGRYLSENYSITPFSDENDRWGDESEERIKTKCLKNIKKYITKIDLIEKEIFDVNIKHYTSPSSCTSFNLLDSGCNSCYSFIDMGFADRDGSINEKGINKVKDHIEEQGIPTGVISGRFNKKHF